MKVVDSRQRKAMKRLPILKQKYGKDFKVRLNEYKTYVIVKKKNVKWTENLAMEVCSDYILVWRSDCLDMAKKIAAMFDIDEVELKYLDDLEEDCGLNNL